MRTAAVSEDSPSHPRPATRRTLEALLDPVFTCRRFLVSKTRALKPQQSKSLQPYRPLIAVKPNSKKAYPTPRPNALKPFVVLTHQENVIFYYCSYVYDIVTTTNVSATINKSVNRSMTIMTVLWRLLLFSVPPFVTSPAENAIIGNMITLHSYDGDDQHQR